MSSVKKEIGVVGVPFNLGQLKPGVAQGPTKLREAGMLQDLAGLGYTVQDTGDLTFDDVKDDPPAGNIEHPRSTGAACQKISDAVYDVAKQGKIVLSLGGDHAMAIGTVHGHAKAESNMCLVWVDAHSDINTPTGSPSGNVHGMPVAFLLKEIQKHVAKVPGFEWVTPCLSIKDIVYIGLRDIDSGERVILDEYGIKCFTMREVDEMGIEKVMKEALQTVNPKLDKPIHLSFDIDGLDPATAPSTGTPVKGGLTIREGKYIAEQLYNTGKLTGVDLVEVNPELGSKQDQDLTATTACEIVASCFGKQRKGNVPDDYVLPKP